MPLTSDPQGGTVSHRRIPMASAAATARDVDGPGRQVLDRQDERSGDVRPPRGNDRSGLVRAVRARPPRRRGRATTAPAASSPHTSSAAAAGDLDRALSEWAALSSAPTRLHVAGEWRAARGGRTLGVEDPATGATICRVADASDADCRAALGAAVRAGSGWGGTTPRERARILRRGADRLAADADRLATVMSVESGKPLAEARDEVAFAADYLEWSAEAAMRVSGRLDAHPAGGCRLEVRRAPVGPCLVITPWNFPLAIPARSVGAALAAGCTVVHRASDLAPLSALCLAQVLADAGLPGGCLNVVVAREPGVTDGLLADPRLRKLTFTGSTRVGAHLLSLCAPRALRATVELGGNAPFIVLADADLDRAVAAAMLAKCRNSGQACTAANRFYVARSIAEEFTALLARRMAALRMRRGTDPGAQLGPMISAAAVERLGTIVDDAVARGARTVLAGGARSGPGHFFAPVVLADVPDDARAMCEEIFGPVVAIAPFDAEDEAVERANRCDLGLAAYVMGGDPARARRVAENLQVGMVGVNRGRVSCAAAPFGGVKGSGYGRAGGLEALDDYLDTAYLVVEGG
jgi:succinate-semialdehyde dehydrogenase / glutarate-semialdehyde dehydrogenase